MAAVRKTILAAGFGRFATFDPAATAQFGPDAGTKTKALLETSVQEANDAGFDIVAFDVNPRDPEDSLKRLIELLKSRTFDGLTIGYGVRGQKENTELFEQILNTAWKLQPGVKILFSNGPDNVITAIQRNFPESFQQSTGS